MLKGPDKVKALFICTFLKWPKSRIFYIIYFYDILTWESNPGVGGAIFSAPVQTDPGAHPFSYSIGTGVPGAWLWHPTPIKRRGSRKSRTVPLRPLWAFLASSRLTFAFLFFNSIKTVNVIWGRLDFCCVFLYMFLYWHTWGWSLYRPKHVACMWGQFNWLKKLVLCWTEQM